MLPQILTSYIHEICDQITETASILRVAFTDDALFRSLFTLSRFARTFGIYMVLTLHLPIDSIGLSRLHISGKERHVLPV